MKLSEADKLGLSPEEVSILEADTGEEAGQTADTNADAAAAAAGDAAAAEGAAAEGAAAEGAATEKTAEGESSNLTQEEIDDALRDDKPVAAPAQNLPTYDAGDPKAIGEQRKALRAKRSDIEKDWSTGKITDDERAAQLDELQDQLDNLLIQQTRSETLQSVNEKNVAVARESVEKQIDAAVAGVIESAKAAKNKDEVIDYATDEDAQAQFDTFFDASMKSKQLRADLASGKATFKDVAERAHKAVLAMRGIAVNATAAAPAPAAAAAPKPPRDVPKTLSGIPNAGNGVEGDENWNKFSTLSGDDSERFLAGLAPKEVDRLLRLADQKAFGHAA